MVSSRDVLDYPASPDPPAWGGWWSHPFPQWSRMISEEPLPPFWLRVARQLREELGVPPEVRWVATGHQPWPFHPGIVAKILAVRDAVRTWGWWGSFHLQTHAPVSDFAFPVWETSRVAWKHPFPTAAPYETFSGELPLGSMREEGENILRTLGLEHRSATLRRNCEGAVRPGSLAAQLRDWVGRWMGEFPEVRWISTYRIFATDAFGTFFRRMVRDPEALHRVIQEALDRYRRRHRIRTRAQPFADLRWMDPWVEVPFWWITESGRQSLWIHRDTGVLRVGDEVVGHRDDVDYRGKIFPKALMLTLFYRYIAVDLFVHGLGGMRYDEVTDAVARAIGFPPRPRVAVTLSLGLAREDCDGLARAVRDTEERLKHLRFRAERFLPEGHPLRERKARLVEAFRTADAATRSRLHEAMKALNEEMSRLPEIQTLRQRWEEDLARQRAALNRCRWIVYREYPFYFFEFQEVDDAFSSARAGLSGR